MGDPTAERPPLAVVHAAALYRPTPPIECDEDGYPFSDAKPMSEGDYHGDVLDYAKGALRARFAGHEVYASTDKFLFLEEGNRRAAVVPDVLVAFGPPSGPRQSYKHWEEGKAPDFVLEVLSADNWRNDIERKPVLYAELGVREYWTFDPRGVRTDAGPPLEGWRFDRSGTRTPIVPSPSGDFRSDVLGLDLFASGRLLRFRDPATREILPDHVESEAMRAAAESRADAAELRAAEAASRADSRVSAAESRASAAESQVVAAKERLAQETAARQAAQRRIEELERRLRGSQPR
ncbi:MAG: Uma2 family endonuclease [Gammaproteobacteria bacterium]|nr:Uma2 family endonuclease [Gammaproteobacteria bacterium]